MNACDSITPAGDGASSATPALGLEACIIRLMVDFMPVLHSVLHHHLHHDHGLPNAQGIHHRGDRPGSSQRLVSVMH